MFTTTSPRVGIGALLAAVLTVLALLAAPAASAAEPVPPAAAISTNRADALGSGGRHMSSDVTWYPAAGGQPDRLVGLTKTWNNVKLTGFTGSVLVLFVNDHGQTVGFSPVVHPLGVDGKWIGRWSRTDAWQFDIAPDQTRGAVGIEIVHSRGGVDRLQHTAEAVKTVAGVVQTVRLLVAG